MCNQKLTQKMKVELNSVYGSTVTAPLVFRVIIPVLTDDEIIQKVRKQIRLLYRYTLEGDVRSEIYQYGRVEGLLYGFFTADRLSMEDFEKFFYVIECMDNEFYGRCESC